MNIQISIRQSFRSMMSAADRRVNSIANGSTEVGVRSFCEGETGVSDIFF
jgi:hypothetical protein